MIYTKHNLSVCYANCKIKNNFNYSNVEFNELYNRVTSEQKNGKSHSYINNNNCNHNKSNSSFAFAILERS